MLHFNTESGAKERCQTKQLNLQEETLAVDIINEMLAGNWVRLKEEKELLQRFINNYQNLCHYKDTNFSLGATDMPNFPSDRIESGSHG